MNQSAVLVWWILVSWSLVVAMGGPLVAQPPPPRPNIVLIMADDFGYECVGANGGQSWNTPCLDRLARRGIRFEHCYSQPLCTPSRVQLMTGIYNVRNYTRFGVLEPGQITFANLLRDSGYRTCVTGKWQLKGDPGEFGFDEYCLWQLNRVPERYPNPGLEINGRQVDFRDGQYGPDVVSDYACQFIRDNRDRPFLLYYPMILTHCPFCPTPDSDDWDPASGGSATYKGDPAYFGDMVAYMDKLVGKIDRQLRDAGVADNTLLLFTGDNGTDSPVVSRWNGRQVAAGKKMMSDAGTRVPLIATWPGTIPSGQVSQDLVDFSDFLPTLCDVGAVGVPDRLAIDGRSFLDSLRGQPGNPREWVYCWFSRNGGAEGKQWARNRQYKLYADGRMFDVPADPLEQSPLNGADLSAEARSARATLQTVLERYREARPPEVAAVGQAGQATKKQGQRK